MTQASALTQPTDTREVIVESAYECFRKQGLQKVTIVDIAKAAGVSRSTIYEYFRDKAAIVEACAEHASQWFYREMSSAMHLGGSLEDKLSRAAVFVTQ
ncbi:MAG: TetR/AcrR family transcriptional regulator, partial [Mycobacterium sp.]